MEAVKSDVYFDVCLNKYTKTCIFDKEFEMFMDLTYFDSSAHTCIAS